MDVNTTTFLSTIAELYAVNRSRGMRFDCEGMKQLLEAIGNPERMVPAIHVAGTNGKGSVSTKIAAALTLAGLKTGLYTSPHISSFRERIRINGAMIPEEKVVEHLAPLFNFEATFFEYVTALAFTYFANERVDRAVLEVGLGGRLDATNLCHPILTIITSISLDHTKELGDTIECITREKAGIIKSGVPIVIGPRVSGAVVEPIAKERGAPLFQVEGSFATTEEENQAVARMALQLLQVDNHFIEAAIQKLPPCRFELFETQWGKVLLDVAHNPDGVERLVKRLQSHFPKNTRFHFVYGASKDKDFGACLQLLKPIAARLICVEAASPRAASAALLASVGSFETAASVGEAIASLGEASGVTIVLGTFFIMAEARRFLGVEEAYDPLDLNEAIRQKEYHYRK